MPLGRRRARSKYSVVRSHRDTRIESEPLLPSRNAQPVSQELYRGVMDELVKPAGHSTVTVWMLAWRCKRCGYVWPIRRIIRTTGPRAGSYLKPKPGQGEPGPAPKKCPGCDSPLWWKDYDEPLTGGRRGGRRRVPYMAKTWRDMQAALPDALALPDAAEEETPSE